MIIIPPENHNSFPLSFLLWEFYFLFSFFRNLEVKNLKYLTIDQALADTAYFVDYVRNEKHMNRSQAMVFGSFYAGNLAAWMRVKYAHVVDVSTS